jgi:hypothetical protein
LSLPPIYSAEDATAPAHLRAVAWMSQDGPGKHWTCAAPSQEEARAKLSAFWLKCEAAKPARPPPRKKAALSGSPELDDDEVIV